MKGSEFGIGWRRIDGGLSGCSTATEYDDRGYQDDGRQGRQSDRYRRRFLLNRRTYRL